MVKINGTTLSGLGAGILKQDAKGVPSLAVAKTDYAPATSGSTALKGDGSGGFGGAASTDLSDSSGLVRGAASLTTDNAIPKISATDGTLAESVIVDNGTNVLIPSRKLALGGSGTPTEWITILGVNSGLGAYMGFDNTAKSGRRYLVGDGVIANGTWTVYDAVSGYYLDFNGASGTGYFTTTGGFNSVTGYSVSGVSVMNSLRQIAGVPGSTTPAWAKYALVAIANGVNGCTNANGCWQVNGVRGPNKAAALTQDVPLFTLSANGHVSDWRIKTNTACSGATTINTGLGTTGSNVLFRAQTYDLTAAVSNTNLTNGPTAGTGSDTAASTSVVASLITTVANVDQIATGCAVDYWALWSVLP